MRHNLNYRLFATVLTAFLVISPPKAMAGEIIASSQKSQEESGSAVTESQEESGSTVTESQEESGSTVTESQEESGSSVTESQEESGSSVTESREKSGSSVIESQGTEDAGSQSVSQQTSSNQIQTGLQEEECSECLGSVIPVDFEVPEPYHPAGFCESSSLPSSYSSPTSTIKNQGSWNLCWAFSMSTILEKSAMSAGLYDTCRFNEFQIYDAHDNSNNYSDPLGLTDGDYVTRLSDDTGGNAYFTMWEIASLVSPVSGSDSTGPFGSYNERTLNPKSICILDRDDTDEIKQAIKDYGAVHVAVYATKNKTSSREKGTYFYTSTDMGVNHAVTLVGWDDSIEASNFWDNNTDSSTNPSSDGAFQIQNSWGTSWGDDGYGWLSYEDVSYDYLVAIESESADHFDNFYEYDGSFGALKNSCKRAVNVFTAAANSDGKELIIGAGCGIYTPGSYQVEIYDCSETDATEAIYDSSKLLTSETLTVPYAGYYTLDFPTNPLVLEGEKFAISLRRTDGKTFSVFVDASYNNGDWIEFNTSCASGQSLYVTPIGRIVDCTDLDSDGDEYANARLKVFTDNENSAEFDLTQAEITIDDNPLYYTGQELEPSLKVNIDSHTIPSTYLEYSYSNNVEVGEAEVTVTGSQSYITGSKTVSFNIVAAPLSRCQNTSGDMTGNLSDQEAKKLLGLTYNGISLQEGTDYEVISATGGAQDGGYVFTLNGLGNYSGDKEVMVSYTGYTTVSVNLSNTGYILNYTPKTFYDGRKHVWSLDKNNKSKNNDMVVTITDSNGKELPTGTYKVSFHNSKKTSVTADGEERILENANKFPYFTVKIKGSSYATLKAALKNRRFYFDILPARLSEDSIIVKKTPFIKNGKVKKLNGLYYLHGTGGYPVKMKYKNNTDTDFNYEVSENSIVLGGNNNFCGSAEVALK
ncbi:MAG: hypothetical protein K5989_03770 [Lachnospiraceae bacterium]|nr:hypothetical protein [Lachnospiraceae bacterium]